MAELWRGMREQGHLVRDEVGCWVEGPVVDWETMPDSINHTQQEMALQLAFGRVASFHKRV